jgi:hypothetical protein
MPSLPPALYRPRQRSRSARERAASGNGGPAACGPRFADPRQLQRAFVPRQSLDGALERAPHLVDAARGEGSDRLVEPRVQRVGVDDDIDGPEGKPPTGLSRAAVRTRRRRRAPRCRRARSARGCASARFRRRGCCRCSVAPTIDSRSRWSTSIASRRRRSCPHPVIVLHEVRLAPPFVSFAALLAARRVRVVVERLALVVCLLALLERKGQAACRRMRCWLAHSRSRHFPPRGPLKAAG